MKLETVRIEYGEGFLTINVTDFDDSIHNLFEKPEPKTRRKKEEPIPTPET
jgi:hypothetical protein